MGGTLFIRAASLPDTFFGDLQLLELFIAYAYILYIGCNMISDGAELLMLTPYSKLVGSCILPVLGAVPDGAIVLFSGLGPDAQTNLAVGVGALAGSTIMLITIPYGLAIYGGLVDMENGVPKYAVSLGRGKTRLTDDGQEKGCTVGVAGYSTVLVMGYWMLATALPYLIVEIGALVAQKQNGGFTDDHMDDDRAARVSEAVAPAALVALIVTALNFCAYLKYQYDEAYGPKDSLSLENYQRQAAANTINNGMGLVAAILPLLPTLEQGSGTVSRAPRSEDPLLKRDDATASRGAGILRSVLSPFFKRYDVDSSKTLELKELARVFEDMNEPKSATELEGLFAKYDADSSGSISFDEFCDGMLHYVMTKPRTESAADVNKERAANDDESPALLKETEETDEEEEEVPDEFAANKFKSVAEQQASIKHAAFTASGRRPDDSHLNST